MRIKNFYTKFSALLFVLFSLFQTSEAQSQTVSGRVTDAQGAGVSGVTVTVRGTTRATQTDNDGRYTIQAANNATLVFTAVGFGTREVSAGNAANVTIDASTSNLDEVVVVGYGTARRRDMTGSVASVRAKDFNRGVITAPDQLIQGKAAGVLMLNNSGQPGGATTVRIRGTSSIRSGNQPLYVVDGVQLTGGSARPGFSGGGIGNTPGANPLNFINPADIASMEILKDASATAIYGARGANGVILITTKRGTSGIPSLDASVSTGVSTIMKRLEVLNGNEYRSALKTYNQTGGDFGGNVDALDAVLQSAITQNYTLGIGGGNENGRYRVSGSYLNQEGIVRESGIKKYTGNVTSSFSFLDNKRLNLDFNVLASHTTEDLAPISNNAGFTGSLIGQALQWNPTHPLKKPGNDSAWIDPAVGATTINPLAMLNAYEDRANVTTILASISPSYKLTSNLEYRLLYSINRSIGVRRVQVKSFLNAQGIENRGAAFVANNDQTQQQVTNTFNYNKQLSTAFNLNAVVGHEYIKFRSQGNGISALDFPNVGLDYYNIFGVSSNTSRSVFSFASPTSDLQSFFARAIANIRDKYLFTATFRADGSSRFGENNKYGYFPSFAFGWNVTNEDFLRDNSTFNNLKFRASWGKTGNQEFPSGASRNRFVITRSSDPGQPNTSNFGQTNYGNADLKWETSTTSNVGADFSILKDKITGTLDYFVKKSTDVLFEQTIAAPAPSGRIWVNLPGYIRNSGLEVSLNTGLLNTSDMSWNLGVNASFLSNVVEGLAGFYETGGLSGQGISGATSQRIVNGQPLNVFYLPRFQGIDKTTGQSTYAGGDPASNKFYHGSPNPKTILGISTDFTYNKFSAYLSMNGNFGHFIYNNTANTVLPIGNIGTRNIAKSLINTGVKEDASNPIAPSTRYLEKGNYLKLANATLSYRVGNVGSALRNVNISLTGQNLFVITKYSGFDPEVNTDASIGGIPSLGIEYTPYPSSRTILLGVSVSL